jgi:NAD(P)-dependent dehydrogenase (short-subunit alcohol dehydrogenase family)
MIAVKPVRSGSVQHDLDGLVGAVTGGSQGLGRAIALELSAQGAAVIVVARREDRLGSVVDELRETGRAAALVADVADAGTGDDLVRLATGEYGRLDILVNNAAYEGPIAPFLSVDESELHHALAVNLIGVWRLCRAVVPGMLERGYGRIINLMGPIPEQPAPFHAVVGASKGAALGLTRSLAAELAPGGVTVNALCAGAIYGTEMSGRMLGSYAELAGVTLSDVEAIAVQRSPQLRLQELDEVAAVAAFLASPAAGAITAQSVKAAGGMLT